MSNGINLASLGFGGIDTSSLVTSLVAIEQKPVAAMAARQRTTQSAAASLSNFASTLGTLANAASTLADATAFTAMKATSSDPAIAASTKGSAAAGQWSVSVSAIAEAQRTLSTGHASSTSALGLHGSVGVSLGDGTTASVPVADTDTLSDVAAAINGSGLRLHAGVMYDGAQYHLLVSGTDTGAKSSFSFDDSGLVSAADESAADGTSTTSGLGLSLPSSTIQVAQDASLTVGGQAVTSASNQVTDAIPGVTLALTRPTSAPVTIGVAGDSSGVESQVQTFVSAFNAVIGVGHATAGFGKQAAQNELLQGDSSVHLALHQLAQIASERAIGTGGPYTTLASVGIRLKDDGSLSFDASAFAAAFQADPASVTKLFATDASGGSSALMAETKAAISALTEGKSAAIQAKISGLTARSTALATQITKAEARVSKHQADLETRFAQMNKLLQHYKQTDSALTQAFNQSDSSNNKAW
jgi:flagellar hook-associated protein 2